MTKNKPPKNPSLPTDLSSRSDIPNRADLFQNKDVINLHRIRKDKQKQDKQRSQKGAQAVLSFKQKEQQNHVVDQHKLSSLNKDSSSE